MSAIYRQDAWLALWICDLEAYVGVVGTNIVFVFACTSRYSLTQVLRQRDTIRGRAWQHMIWVQYRTLFHRLLTKILPMPAIELLEVSTYLADACQYNANVDQGILEHFLCAHCEGAVRNDILSCEAMILDTCVQKIIEISGFFFTSGHDVRSHWCVFRDLLTHVHSIKDLVCIAHGDYSKIWRGRQLGTDLTVVIKIVDKIRCNSVLSTYRSSVHPSDEVLVLKQMNHPNILQCLFASESVTSVLIVSPYCDGSDLVHYLSDNHCFLRKSGIKLALDLFTSLVYLHSISVVHRDIKPENIFLTSRNVQTGNLVLGDFGLARKCHRDQKCFTIIGTPCYRAPEMHGPMTSAGGLRDGYNELVDVWCAGIVLYTIFCGSPPFPQEYYLQAVLNGEIPFDEPEWDGLSDIVNIVCNCLAVTPCARSEGKVVAGILETLGMS